MDNDEHSANAEKERKAKAAQKKREWRAAKKAALSHGSELAVAKKATKEAKRTARKGRGFAADAKITLLVTENPKRIGTATHRMYAQYRDGMSVAEFRKIGGTASSLRWDIRHKFISVN